MPFRSVIATTLVGLTLQGCAGPTAMIPVRQQQSLDALQLFNPDASPRFSLYLACSETYGSCAVPENAFSGWARDRNIPLHLPAPGDPASTAGLPDAHPPAALRYRVTIDLEPLIIPSFDESGGVHGDMRGGYTPAKVGYTATVHVLDAASGRPLLDLRMHDQREAAYKADASQSMRSEMNALIGALDSGQAPD